MSTKILFFIAGVYYGKKVSPIVSDVFRKTVVRLDDSLKQKKAQESNV
jgi:hypothetical protein